jgi:hypothetical protein
MAIYDEKWLREIDRRYRASAQYDRTSPYFFITNAWVRVRRQVEDWLRRFPELASPQLVIRLRTPGLHVHAIYELAVGVTLKAHGFDAEHERQFGEVTPDWYVRGRGNTPALVIDATTVNRPKDPLTKERAVSEFLNAVRGLKAGAKLRVDETDENGYRLINSKVTAKAVAAIKRWLEESPSPSESLEVSGFRFTLTGWKHGSSVMTTSRSSGKPYYVDPTKFIKPLEAKVSRYGRLEENIAIAVAVGADERCGLNLDSLKQILYGRRKLFAHHESTKLPPDVIRHLTSANNKGLFHNKPLLSCVLWVELDYIQGLWTIVPLYNPYARNALPGDTFKQTWLL